MGHLFGSIGAPLSRWGRVLSIDNRAAGVDCMAVGCTAWNGRERHSWSQQLVWIGLAGAEEWFWCFLRAALWEIALGLAQVTVSPV